MPGRFAEHEIVKVELVEKSDPRLADRAPVDVTVRRRVAEMVEIEVGDGRRFRRCDGEVGAQPRIDLFRNLDDDRQLRARRERRKLLCDVVGDSRRRRRQRAPDVELHARPSVKRSIT